MNRGSHIDRNGRELESVVNACSVTGKCSGNRCGQRDGRQQESGGEVQCLLRNARGPS